MKRIYLSMLEHHLAHYDQMMFLTGPRQVGKTTLAKMLLSTRKGIYLNWDNLQDKLLILQGYDAFLSSLKLNQLTEKKPLIVFDEIHKMVDWKNFLKGFFDTYKGQLKIIVTGSAKMDVYQKGGDSLMGRYFIYYLHPFSVAECVHKKLELKDIQSPKKISQKNWNDLLTFGGFPEPFLKRDILFVKRWQNLKHQQLFREDLRDLNRIRQMSQCELLATTLQQQATQLLNYSKLAQRVRISDYSVREWLDALKSVYYCFFVHPWAENISRALVKEPKCYLWDWSMIQDEGARIENFVACHLLKAIHFWTDMGLGKYELFFVRDKDKNEVDFLIAKEHVPWILIEVKKSANSALNPALYRFQKQLRVKHILQLAFNMPYVDRDCLSIDAPMIVPAQTFLSQLV